MAVDSPPATVNQQKKGAMFRGKGQRKTTKASIHIPIATISRDPKYGIMQMIEKEKERNINLEVKTSKISLKKIAKFIKISKMASSKFIINMRDRFKGLVFFLLLYLSIFTGFFFMICPVLVFVIIDPIFYRKMSDLVFGLWEPFPGALMEILFGVRIILSGDNINPFERSLFIMNHRTRVDWNFLWLGLFHCCQPNAHNMKFILKVPVMHIPIAGWVMQACSFIFVHRNWKKDELLLTQMLDYLNESDNLYQILLFPEGTDLTESNIEKSHKYAEEHQLEKFYQVLLPRTKGFTFVVNKMKTGGHLKAIYDISVAYPQTISQNEMDLVRGKFPEEVHFHVKRYCSTNIPDDEDSLKDWLFKVWKAKEKKLQKFYSVGYFEDSQKPTNSGVDYGKLSIKNGTMKHMNEGDPNSVGNHISIENVSCDSGTGCLDEATDSEIPRRNHRNCNNANLSGNYQPSYLQFMTLIFWILLMALALGVFIFSKAVKIWVLVHFILFIMLSLVSNGFHHIAASAYFYRHKRKSSVIKKTE